MSLAVSPCRATKLDEWIAQSIVMLPRECIKAAQTAPLSAMFMHGRQHLWCPARYATPQMIYRSLDDNGQT